MPVLIISIVILGIGIITIIFFAVKSFASPRKIATLDSFVKQGRSAAALRLGKQILAKDPRNAEAHYLVGRAYLLDNRPELALMELKQVNQTGKFGTYCPEEKFRSTLAELFKRFRQYEEALKEYLMLIRLRPSSADYHFQAGILFEDRGITEKAVEFYRKSVELHPRFAEPHYRLGNILYRNRHPQEAKPELEAAISSNPEHYKSYYYLGRILRENHDYIGALLALEKAQKDQSLRLKVLIERGSCHISLGNLDKAMVELQRGTRFIENEAAPESLFTRYLLSSCYEKLRKYDAAIDQWEIIYAKKPSFRDVAEKLSQYQDLRTDDRMKDYLTSTQQHFAEICRALVEALGLSAQDTEEIPNGCQVIAVEQETKWKNGRRFPILLRFFRVPELLDVSTVRAMHEDMKGMSVMRGMIIASTRFSRSAAEFAETRPVELVDREALQKLLKQTTIVQGSRSR